VFDENGEITDYNTLKFSVGDLPLPGNIAIQDDAAVPVGIKITWTDNLGMGITAATDRLRVLAMCNGEISILSGINVTRADKLANILLPFGAGVEANIYIFFENATNTKYSTDKHALVAVS
jgi:hypothetical protein